MGYQPDNIDIPPTVEWVIVDDNYHHISEYSNLPKHQRPENCFCPICKEPVILRFGKIRQHHYAHQEGVECTSTRKETAIHYNTKIALYQALRQALSLEIISPCSGCIRYQSVNWIPYWDTVQVEYTVGSFRPDIAIIENGRVIAAIEIYVSSLVSEEKKRFFDEQNIKWIELEGSEEIYRRGWSENIQLEYTRGSTGTAWTCNSCQDLKSQGLKTPREEAAERQLLEETKERIVRHQKEKSKKYKKDNGIFIRAISTYDSYGIDRERYLAIIYIRRIFGATVKTWISIMRPHLENEIRAYSVDGFVKEINDLRVELIDYLYQHHELYDMPLGWLIFPDEPDKMKSHFIDMLEHLPPHYEMQDDEWVKISEQSWGEIIDDYLTKH